MPRSLTEIGRIQITGNFEVVLSLTEDKSTYILSKYIKSLEYTGWAKGAIAVPVDMVVDFLGLFGSENLKFALGSLE
ncbi:MAG: hypothetical protein FJ045_05305 [Crenarchaeota archaeon]|nr:hypothetical protein [Thermoproteota archaeon]